jgi:predicted dehydrogenase
MTEKTVRCAVIGVGHLGKFHTEKYAQLPNTKLVAVVDNELARAEQLAEQYDCQALTDYTQLIDLVDAVSIVTPTQTHFQVAKFFLEHGIHCLIEKPITTTVEEAEELIEIAKQHHCLIQVGHLERFNSAIVALHDILTTPRFIESHRIAPFTPRGADVNVVLDLMIHDIDLIRFLVNSPVRSIAANGAPILTNEIDIANARIEFENGCVANVTASRAGMKQERTMRIFQSDAYISVDLQQKTCSIYRKGNKEMFPGIPEINKESSTFPQSDAILAEIAAFIHSIQTKQPSPVPGEAGKEALEIAARITDIVKGNIL